MRVRLRSRPAAILAALCGLAIAPVEARAFTSEQCHAAAASLAEIAANSEATARKLGEMDSVITDMALGSEGDAFNRVIQFGQARNKAAVYLKGFAATALAVREDMLACTR